MSEREAAPEEAARRASWLLTAWGGPAGVVVCALCAWWSFAHDRPIRGAGFTLMALSVAALFAMERLHVTSRRAWTVVGVLVLLAVATFLVGFVDVVR